jgi:hypothetical protein
VTASASLHRIADALDRHTRIQRMTRAERELLLTTARVLHKLLEHQLETFGADARLWPPCDDCADLHHDLDRALEPFDS